MIFKTVNLDGLTCIKKFEVPLQVEIRLGLNNIQRKDLNLKLNQEALCHIQFLCQNQVLIVCMTQDQMFHTYGPKVLTDNQMP